MDNELLVKSIRELCKKNNVAVSQLENDLNFGAGLISRWVKSSPSLDKIVDIADYFHVTLDEATGRTQVVNDEFIAALIEATEKQTIIWHKYNNINNVKKYPGKFIDPQEFVSYEQYELYNDDHDEISYYASFKNGYISIYSFYTKFNMTTPQDILLFIQPGADSELVPQRYSTKELLPLWLKVVYTLGEECPDEIKAMELKNNFINTQNDQFHNINYDLETAKRKNKNQFKNIDPQIFETINQLSTTEMQNILQKLSDPQFNKMMQRLDSIVDKLKDVPIE